MLVRQQATANKYKLPMKAMLSPLWFDLVTLVKG